MGRLCGYGVIAVALLRTLYLNGYTLRQIVRARTTSLWADQWVVVQDLMRHERGEALWAIIWPSYWGHRLVVPRLLFFADAKWASLTSLTWLTMLFQIAHIVLLGSLAWLLLWRKSPALFLIAIIIILNLMLSPFQMENFVWGMQTMFPLVFLAATGAFLCLSLGGGFPLAACIALGLVSSYTMPNGILVWPLLVAQSIYLKQRWRVPAAIGGIGVAVISSYLWHYARPVEMGMGGSGILRHPLNAIFLVGLILGSPFRLTMLDDALIGTGTLAVAAGVMVRALILEKHNRRWFAALFAVLFFLFLSSLSLVAGRLTPKDLHYDGKDLLPGRYFTLICLMWTSIGLLILSTSLGRKATISLLSISSVLFAALTFASAPIQLTEAEDWADFFLATDALSAAFFLNVSDDQLLSVLWPSSAERAERARFLRQRGLAMFHDPRATWVGKQVSGLFAKLPGRCVGAVEKSDRLDDSSWRLQGWAWSTARSSPPDDVLLVDPTGLLIGLARGGLRHGYIPGLLIDPGLTPPPHARFRQSEWLGYARKSKDLRWDQLGIYGLFRSEGKVCEIQTDETDKSEWR